MALSEFKYACPVCGQHMKCDVSQAGTVMECPTCFQKITAPQAPAADDQKFVLTGTKVGDRPTPKFSGTAASYVPAAKGFPGAVVVLLIFVLIAAAVAFVYRGTIFKSKGGSATVVGEATTESNQSPAKAQTPPKPALVPPPSSDTNWLLNLDGVTIPDSPVAGRIHGQDFLAERASFSTNGTLTLRAGTRGQVEFGLMISFGGAPPESLASKTINVNTNADTAARVTLHWKEDGQNEKENYEGGYALRLEFGPLANNRIPGKIYLCAPDELKSYVMGAFSADIRRPRPKK